MWQPTNITGCKLWLKADAGITKDGSDYVSSWADQSGNGNDATQGTGDYQPLWSGNTLNGKPVVVFDGINDYLNNISFTLNQPMTIFVVWKCQNLGITGTVLDSYDATDRIVFYQRSDNKTEIYAGVSLNYSNPSPFSNYILSSTLVNSVNTNIYEEGVLKNTGNAGSNDMVGYTIGESGIYLSSYLNGDIAEIIIYNTALSDSNRQNVERYLDFKYNITGTGIAPTRSVFLTSPPIWSPTNIAGCKLWLKADAGITKDGSDAVSVWADQSGNGNDATQGTGDYQPLWVDATLNGKPVIRFDGINDFLSGSDAGMPTGDVTVFAVVKSIENPIPLSHFNVFFSYGNITITGGLVTEGFYNDGLNNREVVFTQNGDYVAIYDQTGIYIQTSMVRIGSSYVFRSGVSSATKTMTTATALFHGIFVGSLSTTTFFANVEIAEIIIYNTALSDPDRVLVENYLNAKYALY